MSIDKNKRKKIVLDVKIGVIKKLYKDKMITSNQYSFLLLKYGEKPYISSDCG